MFSFFKKIDKPLNVSELVEVLEYVAHDLNIAEKIIKKTVKTIGTDISVNPEIVELLNSIKPSYSKHSGNIGKTLTSINADIKKVSALIPRLHSILNDTSVEVIYFKQLPMNLFYTLRTIVQLQNIASNIKPMLNYVITAELHQNGSDIDNLPKPTVAAVLSKSKSFTAQLEYMAGDVKKFSQTLGELPEIFMDVNEGDMLIQLREYIDSTVLKPSGNVDGITRGFIGNPLYHLGKLRAEWRALAYKRTKDEVRVLELKIIQLQNSKDGKNDAKIDEQIEYYQDRINAFNQTILKYEEDQ